MKSIYSFIAILIISVFFLAGSAQAQVTVSGSTGADGSYTTLTLAFTAINGTAQTGNSIIIDITGNTTETASSILNAGAWTSINIRPSGGAARIITGAIVGHLIDLNGADNVTIDGLNTGSNSLTISNTGTGAASTIRFTADATSNFVQNCTLLGSTTSYGVVYFASGTTTGNDNNTINFCNIGPAGTNYPLNGIYSFGASAAIDNSGISITNSNIYDYFSAGSATNGMNINSNNSTWTITNNRLYQTATRVYTSANTHNGINILSGSGYTITGNVIGYANSSGTGTTNIVGNSVALTGTFPSAYTTTGTANATRYVAISCAFLAGGTVSNIQGNTIAGFALFTSSGAATTTGILCGIAVTSGNANIGTTTGNTIGTPTSSIYTVCSTSGGAIVGIYATSTNTVTIQNNTIQNLDAMGSTTSYSGGITGINSAGTAGIFNISGNTIGNATNPNLRMGNLTTGANLSNIGTTFGTATGSTTFAGILNAATGTITIGTVSLPNIIRNASQNSTSTGSVFRGIQSGGTSGIPTISYNSIYNITSAGTNVTFTSGAVGGIGIYLTSGTPVISYNTIYNLSLTNTGTGGYNVTGVSVAASTNTIIRNNKIYNLTNSSTSVTTTAPGTASGILIRSGSAASTPVIVNNNMISLGNGQATNTSFIGIWGQHGSSPDPLDQVYYNTVKIDGNATSGAQPSFGFLRSDFSATAKLVVVDVRNNIFDNTRISSGAGTGKHYAIGNNYGTTASATGWGTNASNYNVLNSASSSTIGYWTTDKDFAGWKTASASDANSISGVSTVYTNSAAGDLHLNMGVTATQIESGGVVIAGYTTDFDGQARPGPVPSVNGGGTIPDIGADEFDGVPSDLSPPTISYTALGNTSGTGNRTLTTSITDVSGVPTSGLGLPVLYWKINAGAYTAVTATFISGSTYQFTFGAGVTGGDIVSYYVVAQDMAGTPNVGAFPSGGAGGYTINPPAASSPPTTPSSYTILGSISGIKTVGSGGDYATLTAAITALNNNELSGALTFLLLDATYTTPAETFPLVINVNSGSNATNTVTIKPNTGVTSTVTGSSASSIFQINGADYITIDGSNSGGTTRNLTIENTSTGTTSAVIWAQTTSGVDAVTNFTIKNINITGSGNTQTLFGIGFGSTTISTTSLGTGNSSNTVTNNNISKTQYGIYSQGASIGNKNQNNVFSNNLMNTVSPNNVSKGGIWLGFENNVTVSGNNIDGITLASSPDVFGIALGLTGISTSSFTGNEVTNTTVSKNYIGKVTNTGTFSAAGITVASATTGTTSISNNVITGVGANGTAGDFGVAIFLGGGAGSTTQVYYNSISMSGTLTGGSYPNYCLAIGGSDPVTDVKNNIFYNTLINGTGVSFSIGTAASTYTNLTSNYNNFFTTTGATFKIGKVGSLAQGTGTELTLLTDWRTTTSKDANTISANPLFQSNIDLRPSTGSPVLAVGTTIAGITTDFLNATRSGTTPTIGAYENPVDLSVPAISYTQLTGTLSTANRTLTATITDGSGVPTSGSLVPRIYYRKGLAGTWYSQPGALVSGSGTNGSWDFTIVVADMGGVAAGDNIYYYAIAQDIATPINIVSNPTGAVATDVNNVSTHPASPNFYTILGTFSAGTFAIGPSGPYTGYDGSFTTMTDAINTLNTSSIDGDCIFEFQDDYDGTTVETLPLNFNPIGYNGGTFNVTFRPAASNVNPTVISGDPGNSNSLLTLNGTSNLIIDGRPGGTGSTGQMSIINTNNVTAGGTVYIQNEASNVTLRYLTIQGNNASTTSGVVTVKSASGSNANDNINITYCDISNYTGGNPNVGVWVEGISSTATNDNFVLSYSKIHEFGTSAASTNPRGIYLGRCNNASITNNSFYRSTALTAQGLSQIIIIGATGNGAGYTITDNFFGGSAPSAAGTFTITTSPSGVYVIDIFDIASQTTASNITGNIIKGWDLTTTSDAASNTISFCGVFHRSTAGAVNVNNNTIGDNSVNATTNPSILLTTGGVSATNYNVFEGIDVRAGTGTITNNVIGGVRLIKNATRVLGFTGINHSTAGTPSISGNTIGSTSTTLFDKSKKNNKVETESRNINKVKDNNSGNNTKETKISPNVERTDKINNSNINKQGTDKRYFHSEVAEVNIIKVIEQKEQKQTDKLNEQKKNKEDNISESTSKSGENTDNIISGITGNNGSETDNVVIPNISNETAGGFVGIASGFAGSILNNLVANVSMNPATPSGTLQTFTGISISNSGIATANNSVTGNTVRNIFNNSISGTSAGIVTTTNTTGVLTCTNNNLRNITFTSPSSGTATFAGIIIQGTGNYSVTGNNIYSFNSNSNAVLSASGQNVFSGIYQVNSSTGATTNLIRSNNIYDVTCNPLTTSTSIKIQGIFNNSSLSEGTVSKNKVYNFLTSSTATTSMVCGYNSWFGAVWNYSNNVFNLGDGITSDIIVYGVYDYSDNNTGNWYYNTIRVGGTVTSGTTPTAAYFRNTTTSIVTSMQNNILANFRTGGTGSHLVVNNAIGATGWTLSNFNNFYSANTATIGRWGSATDLTMDGWRTASSLDVYTVSWNPGFTSTTDLTPNSSDANSWSLSGNGIHIGTVTDDINGTPRPANVSAGAPDIGAYEFTAAGTPNSFVITPIAGSNDVLVNGRKLINLNFSTLGGITSIDVKFYSGVVPPGSSGYPVMNGYFVVTQSGGSGFVYDITYYYSEPQIGTITGETLIRLSKSDNGGTNWTAYTVQGTGQDQYVLDNPANTVKVHQLSSFSIFTNGGSDNPLPVTLSSFTSSLKGRDVLLSWKTESENNNAGFDVERKLSGTEVWTKAGYVAGKGSSNTPVNYSFEDKKLNSGKYNYRLKQIDNNGNFKYHNLASIVDVALPTKFNLSQNYPNPFNPTTKIDFDLPFDSKVSIIMYDITGREVKTLVNDARTAGFHTIQFNASSLSSGTYFYRIMTKSNGGDYIMTKKMMLVK